MYYIIFWRAPVFTRVTHKYKAKPFMRWAVIGSAGQLGAEFLDLLGAKAVGLARAEADLNTPSEVEKSLLSIRPTIVVNCAAYNWVDKAADHPDQAFATNAWGARNLALICAEHGWPLVHFSTDHVFGGPRSTPWIESDLPAPVNAYGLSKLTGEYWIKMLHAHHFIIRTCGLYGNKGRGGKGGNFVATMLRLAASGHPLRVVADQFCNPSSAREVAAATVSLVSKIPPGTYHLANGGTCSWHEFASAIMLIRKLPVEVQPISTATFAARANRPEFSALGTQWEHSPDFPILKPWKEALKDYLQIQQI